MSHALTVLSYFELADEDQPPERIWLDAEAVTAHFEGVRARRRSGSGDTLSWEDIEPMTENTAQQEEIRRIRGG